MKDLLEKRRQIKKKKPEFIKQDYHKKPRLSKSWRKPKGIDSKLRLHIKGHRRGVSKGYGSPRKVKDLDRSGLKVVNISSIGQLESIDKKSEGALLSSMLGQRKRVEIVKKAKELGIKLLNVKNVEEFLKNVEENLKGRKDKKKKVEEKKEKEIKDKEKKVEEKKEKKETESKTEEEKKVEEKKERDKLLTKKT